MSLPICITILEFTLSFDQSLKSKFVFKLLYNEKIGDQQKNYNSFGDTCGYFYHNVFVL
jgi:hypothetical protein